MEGKIYTVTEIPIEVILNEHSQAPICRKIAIRFLHYSQFRFSHKKIAPRVCVNEIDSRKGNPLELI